ncbi:unnamed protein product, partial [Nesidiocoris tenuis]
MVFTDIFVSVGEKKLSNVTRHPLENGDCQLRRDKFVFSALSGVEHFRTAAVRIREWTARNFFIWSSLPPLLIQSN